MSYALYQDLNTSSFWSSIRQLPGTISTFLSQYSKRLYRGFQTKNSFINIFIMLTTALGSSCLFSCRLRKYVSFFSNWLPQVYFHFKCSSTYGLIDFPTMVPSLSGSLNPLETPVVSASLHPGIQAHTQLHSEKEAVWISAARTLDWA